MNEQELKDAISDMQECRELIGKANMRLNNILTQRKAKLVDAYRDGLNDGKKQAKAQAQLDVAHDIENVAKINYQKGLEDAWDAARKIVTWPDRSLVNSDTFDLDPGENIFTKYSASEAITKLRVYEEKQKADDEIKVGDEVINNTTGTKGILLEPETEDLLATVIVPNNRWNTFNISHINLTKTGRHFNIESIFEEMQS